MAPTAAPHILGAPASACTVMPPTSLARRGRNPPHLLLPRDTSVGKIGCIKFDTTNSCTLYAMRVLYCQHARGSALHGMGALHSKVTAQLLQTGLPQCCSVLEQHALMGVELGMEGSNLPYPTSTPPPPKPQSQAHKQPHNLTIGPFRSPSMPICCPVLTSTSMQYWSV